MEKTNFINSKTVWLGLRIRNKKIKNAQGEVLHLADPLLNLNIKVKLQCLSQPKINVTEDMNETKLESKMDSKQEEPIVNPNLVPMNRTFSQEFKWQEKKFSPTEIITYNKMEEANSAFDKEYLELYKETKNKLPLEDISNHVCLYSYVDKDGYIPESRFKQRTTAPYSSLNPFAEGRINLERRKEDEKAKTGLSHLRREMPYKMYYIMAGVEVNNTDLLSMENDVKALQYHEQILCCIRYYPRTNEFEITPEFNHTISFEDESNMDFTDKFIQKGESEFLVIYTFTTPSGSIYGYTIETEDPYEKASVEDIRRLRRTELTQEKQKFQQELSRTQLSMNRSLEEGIYRTYNMILIDQIKGFNASKLFIEYYLIIPAEWKFDCNASKINPDWLYGLTNTTTLRDGKINGECAYYGNINFLIEFPLITKKPDTESYPWHWPQMLFQVHSYDMFGRFHVEGYGTMDFPRSSGSHLIEIHTWKPVNTIEDEMKSFFIGGTGYIQDINYIANSYYDKDSNPLNRHGMQSESSGTITVQFTSIIQTSRPDVRIKKDPRTLEKILSEIRHDFEETPAIQEIFKEDKPNRISQEVEARKRRLTNIHNTRANYK